MSSPSLTRRRVLAAAGGAAALYLGVNYAGAALGRGPVEMNQRTVRGTYAQSQGFVDEDAPPRIAITWREIVNGEVQEDTGLTEMEDEETGGVGLIVDEAVVPGDSGSVTMRARLLSADENTGSDDTADAELYLLFNISELAENGVNDPEADDPGEDQVEGSGSPPLKSGESGDKTVELAEETQVTVWEDDGIFDANGSLEPLPVIGDTPIVDGTLADVASSPELDGSAMDNTGGYRLSVGGDTCLGVGDEVYVSFEWQIPEAVGNSIQSDSATFQLGFDPRPCQ
jgi:hypothetical protein